MTTMRLLICFLLSIIPFLSFAKESQFIVRSKIIRADTSAYVPLGNVFVSLSAAGSTTPVKYKLLTGNDSTKTTNETGELRLIVTGGQGKYLLSLDCDGFQPVMKEVEVKYKNQNVIWLGNISMHPEKVQELQEVEVKATTVKLVVKGDTMVYNADAFKLADGSMLESLIKQLDGVELDADGQITVNGRKVNSLLLNGKDFFKGDPSVALENLPAYTVKNLKIYDKAAEDDYLTKKSAKLARKEDDENLVMDVVLKKEFNVSGTGTLEAGYGSSDRWLGKAFGLGNTENWRISGFANANNVRDNDNGGGGMRSNSSGGNGNSTREVFGMDYMYDNKKTRVNGNVKYSRIDQTTLNETASTRYYHSGDIYRRSAGQTNSLSHRLSTSHDLFHKWESVYFGAAANFNWDKKNSNTLNRQADFNELPDEETRTEALDSVFARPFSKRYNSILLTRLSTASRNGSSSLSTGGRTEATIRTPGMEGKVRLDLNGNYSHNSSESRTIFLQHFGGASASTSAKPTNSDRYSESGSHSYNIAGSATYDRDWATLTDETWQHRVSFRSVLSYSRYHNSNDYNLFTADPVTDQIVLPSLHSPENAIQDLADSYNSTKTDNHGEARVSLSYSRESIAPSADGFNPNFYVSGSVTYRLRNENLEYHVLQELEPEKLDRTVGHFMGDVNIGLNSGNDNRYLNMGLHYSNSVGDPSLNLFLKNRTNTNPLHIYINNAEGLRSSFMNNLSLYVFRAGRVRHNSLSGNMSWSRTSNSIGQWSQYDPSTGITTSRPMNINGNWSGHVFTTYSHPLGSREQFTPTVYVNGTFNHSVDFQSTTSEPVRSAVDNTNAGGGLRLNYKLKNGSNFTLGGGTDWTYATSKREEFNTVNANSYNLFAEAVIELPANFKIRTNLNYQARRGYEEKAMNTDQWLWNATVSKSIMKGALTFKVTAVDILANIDPVRMTINAQGRTESWTNTLPRYVMFSAQWRINAGAMKNRRGGGGRGREVHFDGGRAIRF